MSAVNPRSSITAAIGIEMLSVSGFSRPSFTAFPNACASSTCAPATLCSSASSKIFSARGSVGLCTGCPKPGIRSPDSLTSATISFATAAGSPPASTLFWASASSSAHASEVPSSTGPAPRIPAATAPCSARGSAASVIRAATFVGIIPCSAIATSSRSRKNRCSSVASRPVSSR